MLKLSFIVPVYNVAPYLRKCVDSLLMQDYDDYEIILVDDGSTDESSAICDEYASRSFVNLFTHSLVTIRVIHQPNAGLSAARNSGILAARGEYLCFVDSDDYWQSNVLGGLMAQVERENLDVLRFDYQNVRMNADTQAYEVFEPNKTPRYMDRTNEIVDGETYLNTRMGYACYAVMFILRRDIILNLKSEEIVPPAGKEIINHKSEIDDCLFTPGLHFEDVDWLPRMMVRAKRVNSTRTIVYNYCIRQGSITKTQSDKEKIRKNINDSIIIIGRYQSYREQYPNCQWLHRMQSNMAVGTVTSIARELYKDRCEYISKCQLLKVFPVNISDQGKTYRRRAFLINILGIELYCRLMHCL